MHQTPLESVIPKLSLLRWEIGFVMLIKILLLLGLWFLIFRWMDKPTTKPDIAEHFALPIAQTHTPVFSSQPNQESRHVR